MESHCMHSFIAGLLDPVIMFLRFIHLVPLCAQLLSHVWLFVTPWTVAMGFHPVHGIFQTRILEWVAISSSRDSSWPRDPACDSCIFCVGRQILHHYCHLAILLSALLHQHFIVFLIKTLFIAALFTISKTWKQPKWTDAWIKKM